MKKILIASAVSLAFAGPAFAQSANTPEQYLLSARQSIQSHDMNGAVASLDRAEALMLDDQHSPARGRMNTEAPSVRAIARARQAVEDQAWNQAGNYLGTAMDSWRTAQQ